MRCCDRISFAIASAVLAGLTALSMPALAQADHGTLLKGKDVTEANVLDALLPDAQAAAEEAMPRNRGIQPTLRPSPAQAVLRVKKKPSAALLITFQTNSTELSAKSKEQLDVVAAALRDYRLKDFAFEVEGHADIRGSSEANQLLSQQRAEVARNYLVSAHGVSEARLRAVGKGDSDPMNKRDISAAENRRVAITRVAQ